MNEWQKHPIYKRDDGSYVITRSGHPYHVPNEGEFAALWADVHTFAQASPESITAEPSYETDSGMLPEQNIRTAEIRARLAAIDKEALSLLRAKEAGCAPEGYAAVLAALNEETAALEIELAALA